MSTTNLIQLVPPPKEPVERGSPEAWEAAEAALGLRLPPDYYDYGLAYGSGAMCNGFMQVFNWASPSYRSLVEFEAMTVLAVIEESATKVAVFPECPGLLPWGRDENGNTLCWLTDGDPAGWQINIQSKYGNIYQFHSPMTDFLIRLFTNQIECPVWQEPFSIDEMVFRPKSQ